MLPNILLLLLVFGATRWKRRPYAGALVFALIKAGLYFAVPLETQPLWVCALNGAIGLVVFGTLAAALVYFLRRLDRYEVKEVSYSTSGTEKAVFKWEYFPLAVIVLVLIFGEMLLG